MRRILIGLLVLGLVAVGFSAFGLENARAGVPHVVEGPVGPSAAPGLGNPSNPASATFYLTNKPAEPIQMQPDLQDADGTSTATYYLEVGSGWSWAAGDNVVVVIESVRGVNGWTGANYTTSSDGSLTTQNIDSLPNANIEPLPTLTVGKSPGLVSLTWTGLTDGNQNVVNYTVRRATSAAGPFLDVGRSTAQAPGGTVYFNDTRPQGTWCYKIAANYRRDTTGGVYATTGTSEAGCTTLGAAPTITITSPVDGELNVALLANIVVTFSERMNLGTVAWTLTPPGGITFTPNWNLAQDTLTLTHATPFVQCTTYQMQITGRDAGDDFPLVPGAVPNPWSFTTICPSPQIISTVPASGATGVARSASIVVTFSKAMNTGSISVTPNPVVTGGFSCTWNNPTNTIATCTHATLFVGGTPYTITVAAQDTAGNPLVGGAAPNPWTFTTNNPPTVFISAPAAGVCWTGGTSHNIVWTMSDDATPAANLIVTLSYSTGGTPVTIVGPTPGRTSPYSWTVPAIDAANAAVVIDVTDGAGDTGTGSSGLFAIDTTAPTVTGSNPAPNQQGVAPLASVQITFSEAMDQASTQGATTLSAGGTLSYSWSGMVLTVTHAQAFANGATITVTVSAAAKDACSPGTPLAAPHVYTFRVAALLPNAPSSVAAAAANPTTVTLTWTAPTTYTDGSALLPADIRGYWIERATTLTGARTNLTPSSAVAGGSFTDSGVTAGGTYYYWVRTVLTDGRFSADSTETHATTPAQTADLTWLWILLIIIIVVILIIALLAMRRRKKPVAAPPMASSTEESSAPVDDLNLDGGTEEPGGGSL